jgi:hypothetical protein
MEDLDLSGFDKSVMELFNLCKDVLKISEKRKLSLSDRKNPFLTRLEKYIKTYSKTEPNEHTGYFKKIYESNKKFILLGPQRDNWLLDGNIVISYGEDCNLKTDINLHLSSIYNTSCKIRDEIREESEGLPGVTDTIETSYPTNYMLLLYRIFREICLSENDKTKLSSHIENLESEIGIRSKSGGNDFSGLFDMAAGMAEQVSGNKIPRDKMPGKNDISKMLGDIVNNPKTKTMLGGVMEQLKDTKNIGDIVSKLVSGLGTGGLGAGSLGDLGLGGNSETGNAGTSETTTETIENTGDVNDEFSDY